MISEDINHNDSEIAALKSQVFTLLVALVVISGTFMVCLYRQASMAGKDEAQLNAAVAQNENAIGGFVQKLAVYGQRHPEFVPVLRKYGIPVAGAPGAANK
jgi:hypothetical protein